MNVLFREAVEKPKQFMQALAARIDRLNFSFSVSDHLISGDFFGVGVLSMGRGGSITLNTLFFSTRKILNTKIWTQTYFWSARCTKMRMRVSKQI